MSLPIMTLKKKRERSLLLRHPWIFTGAVATFPDEEEGSVIQVNSHEGDPLGVGFFSRKSQICCRIFEWEDMNADFGSVDYWYGKLVRARDLRAGLFDHDQTNAYRLIAAEGDLFPGLIADVYRDVVVMQVLIKGIEKVSDLVGEGLVRLGFDHVYHKSKRSSRVLEDVRPGSAWLRGEASVPVEVLEHGLRFEVDYVEGQKTGFFLDQRDNRALLRQYSHNKRVLNTFSYSGGFSVYALAAGATGVDSVDSSTPAIEQARRNVQLNFPNADHQAIEADCFEYLRSMESDKYDIIVLDPPAFAKHARAVKQASRGYKQINLQAMRKIRQGGLIFTFSCSANINKKLFRQIVFGAAADSGREVRILHQLHQGADHPINIYHPEGEYLKGFVLHVQ